MTEVRDATLERHALDAAPRAAEATVAWRRTWVDDRPALYGVAGSGGLPVLFLHGWALGSRSYRPSIDRLGGPRLPVPAPALRSPGWWPSAARSTRLPCPASAAPPTFPAGSSRSPATPTGSTASSTR